MKYQYLSKKTKLTNYAVVPNKLFSLGIGSTAMILYAKLLNRANLSIANGRCDEHGRIYIFYRLEDLSRELGKCVSTIKANMNELVEAGLVEKKRVDNGRANMIYVKVPESSLMVGNMAVYGMENKPYQGVKTVCSSVGLSSPNNNKSNREIKTIYKHGEDTF